MRRGDVAVPDLRRHVVALVGQVADEGVEQGRPRHRRRDPLAFRATRGYCATIIRSRRPRTASSSRNCADSNPLELPSQSRKLVNWVRRHGLEHVELRHHDLQDGQRPLERAHGVRGGAALELGLQLAELVQQLLEPQLVDLVNDDEQHLVVLV